MASEAFDPFANDDDDELLTHEPSPSRPATSTSNISADDIMDAFGAAFPSMTLDDNHQETVDFFPSNDFFPATTSKSASGGGGEDGGVASSQQSTMTTTMATSAAATTTTTNQNNNMEGPTFVIAEEMSVVHRSSTNLCSVKVRGNISVEESSKTREQISCNLSFIDPKSHIDIIASKNREFARPITSDANKRAAYHVSMPEQKGDDNNCSTSWFGNPLIEYNCGENLRPVPMVSLYFGVLPPIYCKS